MHTTINQDETTTVREETRDGDRWLVAEQIPIVRPMELSNGYVPERSVANSLRRRNTHGGTGWEGVTATLNHPRNSPEFPWHDPARPDDEVVLAANDAVRERLGLGQLENQTWDGEFVRVDVAVNADRAAAMGGEAEAVVNALEEGRELDVSTQYVGSQLPAGEYDGERRDRAEAIVSPDSLALLPSESGACSIEDGCGIAPPSSPVATANAEDGDLWVRTGHYPAAQRTHTERSMGGMLRRVAEDFNAVKNDLDRRGIEDDVGVLSRLGRNINALIGMFRRLDEESFDGDGDLPGPTTREEERADVTGNDLVREAVIAEAATANPLDVTANQFPDVWPWSSGTECIERMEGEIDEPGAFCNAWSLEVRGEPLNEPEGSSNSAVDEPAESGADQQTVTANTMERDDLIDDITSNVDVDEESLEGMGDSCLQNLHEEVTSNDEPEAGEGGKPEEPEAGTDPEGAEEPEDDEDELELPEDTDGNVIVADREELESLIDDRVEQRVEATANRREKADRVDHIVANSAEYDEDDREELMDTPDGVLDRIERGLDSGFQLPGASGAEPSDPVTANADEFDAGVIDG